MKLELKHLAPYLPYGLKCKTKVHDGGNGKNLVLVLSGLIREYARFYHKGDWCNQDFDDFKPILRPLSDLTKEIEVNGEKFVPILRMIKECHFTGDYKLIFFELLDSRTTRRNYRVGYNDMKIYWDVLIYVEGMRYDYIQKLIEWHFDVFGLIEKGLAIDINT